MTKFVKLFLAVLLLASCSKEKDNIPNLTVVTDKGEISYIVENAQTLPELEKGLMFREIMPQNAGMIFDLSKVEKAVMWMKNTKIALDMIFIDRDGTISWIYENAEPESTNFIIPPFPAVAVLEINAGGVQKAGIKVGDLIKHKFFNNEDPEAQTTEVQAVVTDEVVVDEAPVAEMTAPVVEEVDEIAVQEIVPVAEETISPKTTEPETMVE